MIKKLIKVLFKGPSMDGLVTRFTAKAKRIVADKEAEIEVADTIIEQTTAARNAAVSEKKRAESFIKNAEKMFS